MVCTPLIVKLHLLQAVVQHRVGPFHPKQFVCTAGNTESWREGCQVALDGGLTYCSGSAEQGDYGCARISACLLQAALQQCRSMRHAPVQ